MGVLIINRDPKKKQIISPYLIYLTDTQNLCIFVSTICIDRILG